MPDRSRASIPLIKLPAQTNSPNGSYKGMILTNPGGPGGAGVQSMIWGAGTSIQALTGTNWDIVSWDPRGIGLALPSANCSLGGLPGPNRKRDTLPKIYGHELADSYWEENFSESIETGKTCQTLIGGPDGAGPHMTTSVNVKDMISILDAYSQSPEAAGVPESHMLNYWGFSYGTYIGETFGSLFPERVGKVILDGVMDPEEYSSGSANENLRYLDDILSTFFVYCNLAGPTLCPFYSGTTALDIYNSFEEPFAKLDPTYAFAQNWTNATLIEQYLTFAKLSTFEFMYSPIETFWILADLLPSFLNETAIDQGLDASDVPSFESLPVLVNESLWYRAVACPDSRNAFLNSTLAELKPYINTIDSQSVIAGEEFAALAVDCVGWPIVANEVFTGMQYNPFRKLFKTNGRNRTIWRRYGESYPLYQQYHGPCMSNPEVSNLNSL
jgi:pimeloyl-ACP methyl ester carboxylesterase